MKVVINRCFGGYSLSHEGMLRYCEIKGIDVYPVQRGDPCPLSFCFWTYWTVPPEQRMVEKSGEDFYAMSTNDRMAHNKLRSEQTVDRYDIERNDPALVQTVQELGEKADGDYAKLTIVEIPDDIEWTVEEYDGMEHISEVHRRWGD
jgi:hypothetical protein